MADIEALPEAVALWSDEDQVLTMLREWQGSAQKIFYERLIGSWVGKVERVADLGCGAGRLVPHLSFYRYDGYDTSETMVTAANLLHGTEGGVSFHKGDVFTGGHDALAVVIAHAIVQHQNEPIAAMQRIVELWTGDRYIFSLLVGDDREDLFNSTVVPFVALLEFLEGVMLLRCHIARHQEEKFGWVVLEVSR